MRRFVIALALLTACGKNEKPPPPSDPNFQQESGPRGSAAGGVNMAAAQAMFERTCAMCHGIDGSGRGPASEALNPKPRDYTDPAWQASISDEDIKKAIVLGGQAIGKSTSMPPSPGLKDDPATLEGLVKIIRGFKK